MADKELATVLNSGDLSSIYLGGTTSAHKVAVAADVTPSILSIGATSPLSSQSVSTTPEKLTWFTSETALLGSSFSYSIPNQRITILESGTYKVGGTVRLSDGSNNEAHTITTYLNGIATPFEASIEGDGTLVFIAAAQYSTADYIELYISSTSSTITVQFSNLVVEKI